MTRLCLNRQWRFLLGDELAARGRDFDDRDWVVVGLPHTFDLPYFRAADFYVGAGWYRNTLEVPTEWKPKRLFLEFEGAFQVTDIFVNGREVGRHEGGYTGFCVEITDAIETGRNVIAVRVDNNWNARLAPRAGEHIFCGGIYRDVYLVVKEPVHIAWNGVTVTTPKVTREAVTVNVRTEIVNQLREGRECTVMARVLDPEGRIVSEGKTVRSIGPGETVEVEQTLPAIAGARLWHPDDPALYSVQAEVHDGQLRDQFETPVGFRWFEWTQDRGFFLNGEHLYLRGVNRHQDQSGWGIAATRSGCFRDAKLIKEAGFNFARGSHYPHHPAFAEACDRLGLLFWSEACFWGKGGFGPEGYWNASAYPVKAEDRTSFEESCLRMLAEMIRINRNHPSIVVWSMTNEAFFTYDLERTRALITRMVELSHTLDPTRPAAVGGAQRGQVDKLGDIAGYNGDGARLFIDPGVPNMVSEYGAISKAVDAFEPFWGELQRESFPWRAGEAIWCGFDYGSIAGRQGLKGIVQHNRLPKRSWYWYREHLLGTPPPPWPQDGVAKRLELSADKTTIAGTDALDDCLILVTAVDAVGKRVKHSPAITLTIESGPGELPTGRKITFAEESDIGLVEGQAAIAFRSHHGGKTRLRATAEGLEDSLLIITTEGEPVFVEMEAVTDRPYKRAEPSRAAIEAMKNVVNVARDRPIAASSEAPGHPARLANDADSKTYWQADVGDEQPWVRVDLEGYYQLSGCRMVFATAGTFRFQIEVSMNGVKWTMAIDRAQSIRTDAVRQDVFDPGTVARYVRLAFTGVPPGDRANLCELKLHGVLSAK
jgi:beta-galactosidase